MNNNLDEYVDLVLCGHSHRNEQTVENGVTYAQFGANGEAIGRIELSYNTKTKKVTTKSCEEVDYYEVKNHKTDATIESLIEKYINECLSEADEVVANNVSGYFSGSNQAPNLMCKAIFDRCEAEGQDVVLSYVNKARANLPSGSWTYADIYQSFPFDNEVYIIEVTGDDLLSEVKSYNYVYFNPSFNKQVVWNKKYKIATIDYVAFHTNDNRYYNYFPSFNGVPVAKLDSHYRTILKEWLINNGYRSGQYLYSSDYSSSLDSFNRSLLSA